MKRPAGDAEMLQAEQRIRLNLRWTGGMQLKAVWHPFPAGLIVRLMSQKLGQGGNEIQVPEPSSVSPRQAGDSELIFSQPCGESTDHCRKSRGGPDQLRHIVMKPSHTLEIELGATSGPSAASSPDFHSPHIARRLIAPSMRSLSGRRHRMLPAYSRSCR